MFLRINNAEIENDLINLNLFNIVGSWKDELWNISYHLVKEEEGHGLMKEFDDGSFHMIDVTYENCKNHCLFSVPDSPTEEFFILTDGILELHDKQGKIDTFKSIKTS